MQTSFMTFNRNGPRLRGNESFAIHGDLLPHDMLRRLFERVCAGKLRHWDCIDKAKELARLLPGSIAVVGSLHVWSDTWESNYAYEFNPPYELHAWVMHKVGETVGLIDLALPGVVEMGLMTSDHIGPIVAGREPVILNGLPENWMQYRPCERL